MKVFIHQITISNPCDPTRDTIQYLGAIAYKDQDEAVQGAKKAMGLEGTLRVEILEIEGEPVKVYDTQLAPEATLADGI